MVSSARRDSPTWSMFGILTHLVPWGLRALGARAAMPIAWAQQMRRMGLASVFELLYLEPVLLRA
eukprot:6558185-Pyramimonas_sp.AAC.1